MTIRLYELVGSDPSRPFSPHCWKVSMALRHKGLDFESIPTPFTKVPLAEGGFGKIVPVMRDGDKVVADSFDIALYLDETYPDRPTLFGGEGGKAMARFIEKWSQASLHSAIGAAVLTDIHGMLAPEDQAFFREGREKRFGKTLEQVVEASANGIADLPNRLAPLNMTLQGQPFLGGQGPLFADYIVFGALQWARVCSPKQFLEPGTPVADWFERCLDLHGGFARTVPAAAAA